MHNHIQMGLIKVRMALQHLNQQENRNFPDIIEKATH